MFELACLGHHKTTFEAGHASSVWHLLYAEVELRSQSLMPPEEDVVYEKVGPGFNWYHIQHPLPSTPPSSISVLSSHLAINPRFQPSMAGIFEDFGTSPSVGQTLILCEIA
ncbi:unnamed protein product [Protopolystoma xenopodis]|uniref:Uncharacterized protein n=1 Tax=Protopolystoma xenopodis TaxID=117903 RepID=A0A448WJ10_9PLAT|nr:unnamed protein product [Protopolystoma xenopodis]